MQRFVVAFRLAGLALAGSILLSACGQKRDEEPKILNATADAGRMEDEFGTGFGEAFRAAPNADPKIVQAGDVKPVSSTTEPVPIN